MKNFIKTAMILSVLSLASCSHFGMDCHKKQCDLKEKSCCEKKDCKNDGTCPMKKEQEAVKK